MSENKHEPDEAREHETPTAGVQESAVADDAADTTEVIEDVPARDGESAEGTAGPVGPATASVPDAEPAGTAIPPARSVPETEVIGIGRDAGPAVPGGPGGVDPAEIAPDQAQPSTADAPPGQTQPVPADAPPSPPPSVQHGVPGQASGQGAPPAAPVQTVPHPNLPPRPAPPQGPRVGTVVWGLVVLAIGLGVLAASAGARIDVSLAAILLLGGAGVALVAGSIVSSFRRRGEP